MTRSEEPCVSEAEALINAALAKSAEKDAAVQAVLDGLVGNLPDRSSIVLRDIIKHLCGYLLETRSVKEFEELWRETMFPVRGNVTSLPADDALAIGLLHSVASAIRVDGKDGGELVLGILGVLGRKSHQAVSAAGKANGQEKRRIATEAHEEWIKHARRLLSTGVAPHELTGIVLRNFPVKSATTVRGALQRAGLLPPPKKRSANKAH